MNNNKPSMTAMGASYARELAKWTAAGFPRRTREERTKVAAICAACEHFVDENGNGIGYCDICLCPVHMYSQKLKWATTHCADKPPRWEQVDASKIDERRIGSKLTTKKRKRLERRIKKHTGGCGGCGKKNKLKE